MFTDELITQVRNLAQVPDNDEDITDEFILTQAYLGLLERFTHPIIMLRNGTWLHSYTLQTTAGVSRYRIPTRSIVQGLEKIECATAQGSGNADSSGWYLLSVQTNVQATDYEGLVTMGRPRAFTYVGDAIEIFPTPTASWTLRMWYYLRPPALALAADISFNYAPLYTVTSLGGGIYNLLFGSNALDGYANQHSHLDVQFAYGNCEFAVLGARMSLASPSNITVPLTLNEANMLERATGQSPIYGENPSFSNAYGFVTGSPTFAIPLPQELCNALVSYVGAVVLAEKGDSEKAQVFSQKAELAIKNIVDIAIPRSKGQPSVFKTRNTYLRRRVGRFGRGSGWGQF